MDNLASIINTCDPDLESSAADMQLDKRGRTLNDPFPKEKVFSDGYCQLYKPEEKGSWTISHSILAMINHTIQISVMRTGIAIFYKRF